ncbi:MAG TPA: hypothetical protein VMS94_02195 [Acidobacteriota bacterium]|nr:hypothetical protein [Acidobacteriota bacterium]
MIEKERIEEARRNVKIYVEDGLLKTGDKDAARFVDFFMANAESSLRTASILQEISDENVLKETLKVGSDFESYLWVIVSSYYSMFYAATAILAKQGIRATGQIVHKVTADALIHFFASNEKLAKLLEQYEEAQTVGLELVGREELMKRMQKKADELIISYEGERKKRSKFQYDIGVQAKRGYAQTSLERARNFVFEIRKILKS